MRPFVSSLLAGSGATTVHVALMALKTKAGLLPGFEPYDDVQRLLGAATAGALQPPAWLLAYVNGALILGFVFGKVFRHLPGGGALARGFVFGLIAWLGMGFGLLPLSGHGIFGVELGLGPYPAALMFAMLMAYAITMAFLYERLAAPRA